jgi:hypothetical protein
VGEGAALDEGEGQVDGVGVEVGRLLVGGGVAGEGLEVAILLEEVRDVVFVVKVAGVEFPGGVEVFLLVGRQVECFDGCQVELLAGDDREV